MICYRNCVIVECDNCRELFETGDGLVYHFEAESDIPEQLPERDWTSDGEHHWCDPCRHLPHECAAGPDDRETCARCLQPITPGSQP